MYLPSESISFIKIWISLSVQFISNALKTFLISLNDIVPELSLSNKSKACLISSFKYLVNIISKSGSRKYKQSNCERKKSIGLKKNKKITISVISDLSYYTSFKDINTFLSIPFLAKLIRLWFCLKRLKKKLNFYFI